MSEVHAILGNMTTSPITELTREESLDKLRTLNIGRLVVHRSEDIDIFPINYVVDEEGDIYIHTTAGDKLFSLTLNPDVLFEVDDFSTTNAWSVIVRGQAAVVEKQADIAHAESLEMRTWIPTPKDTFVRIQPAEVSGRAFTLQK